MLLGLPKSIDANELSEVLYKIKLDKKTIRIFL